MQDLVHSQRTTLTEALVAFPALVGFVLRVDVLVVPQVVLSSEGFTTDVAREGPLVRVSSLVDHDVVGLGELAVAKLADEPLLGSGGSALPSHVEAGVVGGGGGGGGNQAGVAQPLLQQQSLTEARVEGERGGEVEVVRGGGGGGPGGGGGGRRYEGRAGLGGLLSVPGVHVERTGLVGLEQGRVDSVHH